MATAISLDALRTVPISFQGRADEPILFTGNQQQDLYRLLVEQIRALEVEGGASLYRLRATGGAPRSEAILRRKQAAWDDCWAMLSILVGRPTASAEPWEIWVERHAASLIEIDRAHGRVPSPGQTAGYEAYQARLAAESIVP